MKKLRIALLLLVIGLWLPTAHAAAPNWNQPVFGVVDPQYAPDKLAGLGSSWARLPFNWYRFQPNSPDEFDTNALPDSFLVGGQVVGLVKGTPPWASSSGSLGAVPNGLDLPYTDPNNVWGSFVTKLVTYYSARGVHHWIVWNEPDIRPGEGIVEFEGEVADYARLLKVFYQAAKAVDPAAHVQIAGMTWHHDSLAGRSPYLARLLEILKNDPEAKDNHWFFDGVTAHIYFTTSSVWDILNSYTNILNRYGQGAKELWLAEFNASPRLDPQAYLDAPFKITLEQQADFIVQASALALAAGTDRMAVYKLYDDHFTPGISEPWGLVRADGSLRPAYTAYRQVISLFSGAADVQRIATRRGTLVTLAFPDHTVYVMWSNTYEPVQFTIGASEAEVTVYDAAGNATSLPTSGGQVIIDAPAAQATDMTWVVVAGAVRIVSLSGGVRSVTFR